MSFTLAVSERDKSVITIHTPSGKTLDIAIPNIAYTAVNHDTFFIYLKNDNTPFELTYENDFEKLPVFRDQFKQAVAAYYNDTKAVLLADAFIQQQTKELLEAVGQATQAISDTITQQRRETAEALSRFELSTRTSSKRLEQETLETINKFLSTTLAEASEEHFDSLTQSVRETIYKVEHLNKVITNAFKV